MKKENTQEVIARKKKQNKILCYFGLVILIFLLFLPPALRLFVAEKKELKKDINEILTCDKADESISATFLNDKPQSVLYKMKGDHTVTETSNPDEETDDSAVSSSDNNTSSTTAAVDNDSTKLVDEAPTNIDDQTKQEEPGENKTEDGESQTPGENSNTGTDELDGNAKSFFELVKPYSKVTYNEEEDITEVRIIVSDLEGMNEYQTVFSTVSGQKSYYETEGFSCTSTQSVYEHY